MSARRLGPLIKRRLYTEFLRTHSGRTSFESGHQTSEPAQWCYVMVRPLAPRERRLLVIRPLRARVLLQIRGKIGVKPARKGLLLVQRELSGYYPVGELRRTTKEGECIALASDTPALIAWLGCRRRTRSAVRTLRGAASSVAQVPCCHRFGRVGLGRCVDRWARPGRGRPTRYGAIATP